MLQNIPQTNAMPSSRSQGKIFHMPTYGEIFSPRTYAEKYLSPWYIAFGMGYNLRSRLKAENLAGTFAAPTAQHGKGALSSGQPRHKSPG